MKGEGPSLRKYIDPGCIPVVILKNCGPELSYIPPELFNICVEESYFTDCSKVSSVGLVFKNVGERSTAKNYCPVSLFSVVRKVFEKLVNDRIVKTFQRCLILEGLTSQGVGLQDVSFLVLNSIQM